MSIQTTLIRHRSAVVAPEGFTPVATGTDEIQRATTFYIMLEQFGYVPTLELHNLVVTLPQDVFNTWTASVLEAVKKSKGAEFKYSPMYPNFPAQVAESTEIELYVNAVYHYLGDVLGLRIMPNYVAEAREALDTTTVKYIPLTVADNTVLEALFVNLIGSKVALNETVFADAVNIIDVLGYIPAVETIPNKENFAGYVTMFGFEAKDAQKFRALLTTINNPTDVLRVLAVQTNSDPALTGLMKFPKTPRALRKVIVERLNQFTEEQLFESFRARTRLWKAAARHLHVSEYPQYSVIVKAVDVLRNGKIAGGFNSELEKAFADKNVEKVVELLSTRPSVFVRRAKEVAYKFSEGWQVAFLNNARNASLTVLLQALSRFETEDTSQKLVTGAGRTATTRLIPEIHPLEQEDKAAIAKLIRFAIDQKLRAEPTLGKVFYRESPINETVPFGLRTASEGNKVIGRGSRAKFDVEETLRFFIHWSDIKDAGYYGRVDVDLSAVLMDENFNRITDIAYYNLREVGGYHSGDITSAPNGASEFIDVHVPTVRKVYSNARYIAMSGIVYTGQPFNVIPESKAGFMVRKGDAQKGEIFDARTVETAFTITSPTRSATPIVFDLVTGEAVWLDLASNVTRAAYNASHISGSGSLLAFAMNKKYVTVPELLAFHVEARADELVDSAEEADTVIDGTTITIDEIMTKWL